MWNLFNRKKTGNTIESHPVPGVEILPSPVAPKSGEAISSIAVDWENFELKQENDSLRQDNKQLKQEIENLKTEIQRISREAYELQRKYSRAIGGV